MKESDNPFFFGKVAYKDRFCNRTREIETLYRYLSSRKNVWLYSPRRFGKTSLVKLVLKKLAEQSHFKTAYLDIFDTADEKAFSLALAQAVANAMSDKIDKVLEFAKSAFYFLAPKITLGDDGKPELQFGMSSSAVTEQLLDEVMGTINKIAEKRKISLVVAIDEFQQIGNYPEPDLFQARLRKHIQHQESIAYIYLGSQRHLMQDIFTSKKKPFFQSSIPMELKLIPQEELVESLIRQTKNTNHPFSKPLAQAITTLTKGHPYHTEKLASYCYDQISSQTSPIEGEERLFLNSVILSIIEQEESIYKNFLTLLSQGQRSVLIAVADYDGKIPSNDMVGRYALSSRQYLDRTIQFLIKKELLDETPDGICIYDVTFRQWLRRLHRY